MNIKDFLLGYEEGKAQGGGGNSDVADYNRKLAETVLLRRASPLGSDDVLNFSGFTFADGNKLASVASYCFAGFKDITGLIINGMVYANPYAFRDCTALKILDITITDLIDSAWLEPRALDGCTALEAIIVRPGANGLSSFVAQNTNSGVPQTGQGANSDYCIYIPSAYYNTVVANISSISEVPASRYRRLEDYPDIANWNS